MMLTAANTEIAAIADVLSPWPDLANCCTFQKRCWPVTILMNACLALTTHCGCSQCIQEPSPNLLSREIAYDGHRSVLEVLHIYESTGWQYIIFQGGYALTAVAVFILYTGPCDCFAPHLVESASATDSSVGVAGPGAFSGGGLQLKLAM